MMRAVIVDGELLARRRLQRACADRPQIEVVAQAADGRSAIEVIRQRQPNLVLLEVELGDMTAFDVLRAVRAPKTPLAVLLTGHVRHASQALDAGIVDFVAKPIRRMDLLNALDRAADQFPGAQLTETPPLLAPACMPPARPGTGSLRLIGERARRLHFLEAQDVDYLEVDGNYVSLHVGTESFLTRQTLTELARLLEPLGFLRIERGLVVNLHQVLYAERLERGAFAFTMKRGQRLVSSRERSAAIAHLLRGASLGSPSR